MEIGDENKSHAFERFEQKTGSLDNEPPADEIDLEEEPSLDGDSDSFEIGASPDEKPEERQSRDEKKRQRGELFESNKRLEQENREMAERIARLEGQAQAVPTMMQQFQQQPQQPHVDPIDSELDDVYNRQNRLYQEYQRAVQSGKIDDQTKLQYEREAKDLDLRKTQLQMQKAGFQQVDPAQQQQVHVRSMIEAQYPDVMQNKQTKGWVQARYQQMLHEGRRDGWDTLGDAMNEAREKFHLSRGNSNPPDENQRTRYSGHSRGSQGARGGSKTYKMTEADKIMANARFGHIPDERKRFQEYVNRIVPRKLRNQEG